MVPGRTPSSCSTTIGSPLRWGIDTGTISSARRPSLMALAARSCEAAASSSCASRLIVAGAVALGAEAHQAGVERAPQAVGDDRVAQLGVAVAEPAAGAVGEVRRVGHRLHAAGDDDVGLAGGDHLVGEVDGVEPGQADLVDVDRRHGHRDAGLDRRLAAGHLALTGHQHLADDDVVDLVGRHAGPFERRLDGGPAEVGGRERGEGAGHLPDGSAGAGDDVGTRHGTRLVRGFARPPTRR